MKRATFVVVDHRGEEIGMFRYTHHRDAENHARDLRHLGQPTAKVSDEIPTMPRRNARTVETTATVVARWERDTQRPKPWTMARLADVFGVDATERASWMRHAFTQPETRPPWTDDRHRSHFATVSLRMRGRCRLSDYRLRLGMSGAELARRSGVSHSDLCALETGNGTPRRAEIAREDAWNDTAHRIADTLGVTCAWLWPEHAPATPRLMREETPTPEALCAAAEMRERVRAAVASLPQRERAVIVRRFGLIDGEEATLEETAPHVGGVSRERVRQLEVQALRQLRAILRNDRDDAA